VQFNKGRLHLQDCQRFVLSSGGNFAKYWGGGSAEGTRFLGGMGECSPRKVLKFGSLKWHLQHWVIPENIHTPPTEEIGSSPPPPIPFGCPNTFTIIRNNFVSPPPPDGRNFLCGGEWIFSGTTHSESTFCKTFQVCILL
jgi:hypothetical protein